MPTKGLEKALKTMTPEQVIDELLKSGLKGRGGAGFPHRSEVEVCKSAPVR